MLNRTAEYDKAIIASSRRQYVRALFDLHDPDMVIDTTIASSNDVQLSELTQVTERGPDESNKVYATLEWNRWLLDGLQEIPPDDPTTQSGQIGWVGGVLSGLDGVFAAPPYVDIAFTGVDVLQAVTFLFSEHIENGYPTGLTVEIYSGTTLLHSRTITGNTDALLVIDSFTVSQPTNLRLKINAWSEAYRRPRVPRVMLGLYEKWSTKQIKSVDIYSEVTFSGLALPYSTCGLTVENKDHRFEPYAPNTVFASIEERQAVVIELGLELYNGAVEWLPGGTYYQQSGGWKTDELTITFNLLDIIGALSKRKFVIPNSLPTTLEGWISAIMASLGTAFTEQYLVDADVSSTALTVTNMDVISGKTCGELLRFACMATNTWPRQDISTGKLRVGKLTRTDGHRITADNMKSYPTMSANEDISDITFNLDSGTVTFAGNNTASETSLSVNNPFIHNSTDAQKAMISCLFEYGGKAFAVTHRGNPSSECGDIQSVDTQFGSTITARLYKQQLKLDKGCMLNVPSYLVQSPNDTLYNNRVVLTGSGTWTATDAGTYRVTLIGGGNGGQGGAGGVMKRSGYDFSIFDPDDRTGGAGGAGGKVYVATVTATAGQQYAYSCGVGGAGGAGGAVDNDGTAGSDGGNTEFGTYSSSSGTRYDTGLMSLSSGDVYAQTGPIYGETITGTYGSGGSGGKNGNNGLRVYYLDNEDDEGYSNYVASRPKAGGNGGIGQNGCIIVEW